MPRGKAGYGRRKARREATSKKKPSSYKYGYSHLKTRSALRRKKRMDTRRLNIARRYVRKRK